MIFVVIQKDAGELLAWIYQNKIEGKEQLHTEDIERITGWQRDRVHFALEYLIRKNLLNGQVSGQMGTTKTAFILIRDINPDGIDVIENKDKFKKNFGFTAGIPGLFIFSWGASQR